MHQLKIKAIAVVLMTLYAIGFPLALHANDISISFSNTTKEAGAFVTPIETVKTLENAQAIESAKPAEIMNADDAAMPVESIKTVEIIKLTGSPNAMPAIEQATQMLAVKEVDIWKRIRKGFAIPNLDSPLVNNHINWYTKRPDYIQRTTTRASLYLFHVVEELEKRNMPTELALLPFIESAFNPQAYSTAKAAGMWQFIPSTGRDFNLKQNVFRDERRDVLASTEAALSYLQKLYGMFGDWQLALAAYNWGEGSVQRAINRNRAAGRPTDFSSLSQHMPAETRNYVPKLQAVKNIIAAPEQYAITLPRVDNEPYFVTIGKTRDIDIKIAAQLAEITVDEFKALNPQFNRPVIIGGANTQILLPQSNAQKFKLNLSKWGHALSSWTVHKVTNAKEKIEAIAHRFGTTPAVIREANRIPPRMHIMAGSTILVPRSAASSEKDISPELADRATMAMVSDNPTRRVFVKVGKRDSLASIAKRNRVSIEQIRSWNNLKRDKVAAGQRLQLQVPYRIALRKGPQKIAKRDQNQRQRPKVATKNYTRNKTAAATLKTSKNTTTTGKSQRAAMTLASTK